ncbi:MAG: lamin tail domain-containing protein [Blastocatellia bacterium]|nr:lamin tail domain-containing protein [Blastocatellia bacterium]
MSPFSYAMRRLHSRHHVKPVSGTRIAGVFALFICFLAIGLWVVSKPQPVQGISSTIVISQVYGGAGCGTAGCSTYKNDYIELFNRGNTPVNVNGWSVQYASATGTSWAVTNLPNVTMQPGAYLLVAEGFNANGVNNLPTPDATGSIAMSATAGKVLLVNVTTAQSGACPAGAQIIDTVGYGTTANCNEGGANAPAPSTTTADIRAMNGCTDTDNNASDFAAGAPNPRNSATALNPCTGGLPSLTINDVSLAEGNSGTTSFTFTVSLSAPAGVGGVTFDIATADGTATVANNDYVAKSLTGQTIAAGNNSYLFTVLVNGDTTPEANETFFVNVTNVTGATVGDGQGQGTINNDDVTLTNIHDIQGNGSTSPVNGASVSTTGVVTGVRGNGFYIQNPDASADADPNTSEGMFVFTSSAPPVAAAVGNLVQVTGTVAEFRSSSAGANDPTSTQLTSPSVLQLSTGNPPPTAATITTADTNPAGSIEQLEKYEHMRVQINSLTVIAPTQGFKNEANATATTSGVFFGVLTGVARPFRETGIEFPTGVPAGSGVTIPPVPRFDSNPERIRVDSDGLGGAAIDVSTGAVITNLIGVLDPGGFKSYTVYPDPTLPPTVTPGNTPSAVTTPTANELTVASFNMERFYDTVNDPATSDVVLTSTAFNNRLNKASLIIRDYLKFPDVLAVVEMENLTTLQALSSKISSDAVANSQPDPAYLAFLVDGNDQGGIDVGFLVKSTKVTVNSVTQVGLTATYINPNNGAAETLNDRPPLVLEATETATGFTFTVIANHLRSFLGIEDETVDGTGTAGGRVRAKRRAQAEFLANLIQSRQTANANDRIIVVGDFNAFQFNDGYVDSIGTIKGTPAAASEVVLASADLVNPDLVDTIDLGSTLLAQRYSYTFDGNAQAIDHGLLNVPALASFKRLEYGRVDADFPEISRSNSAIPDKLSDHDPLVMYFSLPPRITTQPSNQNGCVGGSATFSVVAAGDNLSYQWRKNSVNLTNTGNISGATSTTLTINPVSLTDADTYDCVITNVSGSVTTTARTLTVNAPPTVTASSSPYVSGGTLNLSATPAPAGTYTFSWTGPGGFTSSLQNPSIPGATAANSGTYTVMATNTGTGCSASATTTATVQLNTGVTFGTPTTNFTPGNPPVNPANAAFGTFGVTVDITNTSGATIFAPVYFRVTQLNPVPAGLPDYWLDSRDGASAPVGAGDIQTIPGGNMNPGDTRSVTFRVAVEQPTRRTFQLYGDLFGSANASAQPKKFGTFQYVVNGVDRSGATASRTLPGTPETLTLAPNANTPLVATAGLQSGSEVAVDPQNANRMAVAVNNFALGTVTVRWTDDGANWREATLGRSVNGQTYNSAIGTSLAFDESGALTVAYGLANYSNSASAIAVSRKLIDRLTFSPPVAVVAHSAAEKRGVSRPVIAVRGARTLIAWEVQTTTNREIWVAEPAGRRSLRVAQGSVSHPTLAIGADDSVVAGWNNFGTGRLEYSFSPDGVTFNPPAVLATTQIGYGTQVLALADVMTTPSLTIKADPKQSGKLYATFVSTGNGLDVWFTRSSNNGQTWETPRRLNDDQREADQFNPALTVSASGTVSVAFYDTRLDGKGEQVHVFAVRSKDGGTTFAANEQVTDAPSNTSRSNLRRIGVANLGEHIGIAPRGDSGFVVTWTDTRRGSEDIFLTVSK